MNPPEIGELTLHMPPREPDNEMLVDCLRQQGITDKACRAFHEPFFHEIEPLYDSSLHKSAC